MFDEVDWYGVEAVRRGQEVGVPVPGYSAKLHPPPPVRWVGQGLLQGTGARLCAPGVVVGELGRYGVRYPGPAYMVKGPTARLRGNDDGPEVCQPCCAPLAVVYPECVL